MQLLRHLFIDERNHRHPRLFIRVLTRPDLDKRARALRLGSRIFPLVSTSRNKLDQLPTAVVNHSLKERRINTACNVLATCNELLDGRP